MSGYFPRGKPTQLDLGPIIYSALACNHTLRAFSGMKPVNFIERYLGFSLDRGDGSFEAVLIIMLVTIITGLALVYFKHSLPK
jgi:hypothetical protein